MHILITAAPVALEDIATVGSISRWETAGTARAGLMGAVVQAAIGRIVPLTTAPITRQLAEVALEEPHRG